MRLYLVDFINILRLCRMSTNPSESLIERVRHPFRARHVQLLARESISPGFVRLTLGGPELAGFVSAGFDDHVKLILPQQGQEKPNLPSIVDGRPHIEGARPTMRDYTPLRYDAAANTLQLDFAAHGSGPAVDWALHAPIGQWAGLAGPRGSMVVPARLDWHLLLGDETAMPAIERRLAELPEGTRAIVRVQLANPADQREWTSRAALDCALCLRWRRPPRSWRCPRARASSGALARTPPWRRCAACCWPRARSPGACAFPRTGSRAWPTTTRSWPRSKRGVNRPMAGGR
jgi:NADPH-dependent ferric siderophore reductase